MGPYGSGERLSVRVLEAPGGARQFYAFYDTELEALCRFREVTPEVYACLPWSIDGPPPRRLVWQLPDEDLPEVDGFLDPQCTVPAIWVAGLEVELGDTILVETFEPECTPRPPAGSPVNLDAEGRVQWYPSLCEAVDNGEDFVPTTGGPDPMMSVVDVEPTPFVGGSLVDADGVRRLVAEDGAFEVVSMLDHQDRPCDIAAFELDVCIPGLATTFLSADDACGWFFPSPVCATATPSHAVGPLQPFPGGTVPDASELTVRHVVGSADCETFGLGEEVAPEELTTLERTSLGEGNLVAEYHLDPLGVPTRFVRWWNTSKEASCTPELKNGAWKCGAVTLELRGE